MIHSLNEISARYLWGEGWGGGKIWANCHWESKEHNLLQWAESRFPPHSPKTTITWNFLDLIKNGPYKIAAHQIGYYIHNLFLFRLSRHFPTVSYQFFYWYGYIIFLRAASVCHSYVCL